MGEREDYFSVLGVPRLLRQDPKTLEKNFYIASRALHPDRFTLASAESKSVSLARMSFLNQAYGVLRNPTERRSYYLSLTFEKPEKKALVPELAEAWFELQEIVIEHPAQAGGKIAEFEVQIAAGKQQTQKLLLDLEIQIDQAPGAHELLVGLADALDRESYFKSIERDIEKMKQSLKRSG